MRGFPLSELAALVVRKATAVHAGGQIVSGAELIPQISPSGMTRDDHHAVAEVSASLLEAKVGDIGAEIHDLLALCTRPLGEWAGSALRDRNESAAVVLLDADVLTPTPDCYELAREFAGEFATSEETLFQEFMQALKTRLSEARAKVVYSQVRQFVVRHPVATHDQLRALIGGLSVAALAPVIEKFYTPCVTDDGILRVCAHCASPMRVRNRLNECSLLQCRMKRGPRAGITLRAEQGLLRVRHSFVMFWVGPGLDELAIYDAARAKGLEATLYPDFDACDVLIPLPRGLCAVDVKSYRSPHALASRLNRGIGRLAAYPRRVLAIGDELVAGNPLYIRLLAPLLTGAAATLEVLPVAEVLEEIGRA